ncbi:acylneuraminate cytidylyltransferase family protein [soil metagenome]
MANRYAVLIPIKDHSERVPGKNFRLLQNEPLWSHIVTTLSHIEGIDRIFIDTDSMRFTESALAGFPKVQVIERPLDLRGDFVPTNKLFAHDLAQIDASYEYFLQTHTTNPLLTPRTISRAIAAFEEGLAMGTCDSLLSVTAHHARFYRDDGSAVNHDPKVLLRTQDLDPMLEENSCIYLFTRDSFAKTGARIGEKPLFFEIDRLEATDIDDHQTWDLADALLAHRRAVRPHAEPATLISGLT